MARSTGTDNIYKNIGAEKSSGVRFLIQNDGVFICGKPKEIRCLLMNYASRYRTVKELINNNLN